jgi:hypothetical protein
MQEQVKTANEPTTGSKNENGIANTKATSQVSSTDIVKNGGGVNRQVSDNSFANQSKNNNSHDIQKNTIEKRTEQNSLADIAKNGKSSFDRKIAVEKLNDQFNFWEC